MLHDFFLVVGEIYGDFPGKSYKFPTKGQKSHKFPVTWSGANEHGGTSAWYTGINVFV